MELVERRSPVSPTDTGLHLFSARNGQQLSYQVRGSGPVMVMIPGGPGMDPHAYYAAARIDGLTQVIFCPRGTGASDAPSDPDAYRVVDHVADLEDLRAHLGSGRWALYGSGHGVLTALAFADRHPHELSQLVLAHGPARFDATYQAQVADAVRRFADQVPHGAHRLRVAAAAEETMDVSADEGVRRLAYQSSMTGLVVDLSGPTRAHLDQLAHAPFHYAAVAPMYDELVRGLDLVDAAARIPTPTLVLSGELDPVVPTEHMALLAGTLPDATHVCFTGVGHFPEVEAHDDWSRTVKSFVTTRPAAGRARAQ